MFKQTVPAGKPLLLSLLVAAAVTACGGGDSNGDSATAAAGQSSTSLNLNFEPLAPAAVNNTAADGLSWFNYRRQQIKLAALTRNAQLDNAAQAHSEYQRANNVISHDEVAGAPGYTGAELGQRISAAGYRFSSSRYAYGEVISATASTSGFAAADDLVTAIYHRFVIFEPTFSQAGGGSATVSNGYTYFTANFTANGLGNGVGRGGFVTYPTEGQRGVPTNFFSDREIPDPVPDRNEVGFPVSVHADITSRVTVNSFTLRPQGGAAVSTRLLSADTDPETPPSAAGLIPLEPLRASTTYEVQFNATIDGVAVSRSWTFSTR